MNRRTQLKTKIKVGIGLLFFCTTLNAAPLLNNVDPLQVSVRTVWPPELTTVRHAIDWLITPLGYQVVTEYPAPKNANTILNVPIPASAKLHRTMPVLDAIQILIGSDNTILLDKKHRLLSVARGH
ncbi:hypothetical protein [Aliivibrio sifiae]|uniref:Toxin co-regulated pilus biosynthesis protein Q C-terminal domain-containing protein n=1 Tax=Aliivibrio sifiae TaxID=566293 RepID=A0ABQ6AL70_9GAMM|nr:hypothetical protein [Aliivibrio sifiae]GLR76826.1 hypothetical protein GCM10007855_37010 [Aliivibrio sifiae]